MKAVLTVKLKDGYLIMDRFIDVLDPREVASGTVVSSNEFNPNDKVGRIAVAMLDQPEEEDSDVPY